QTRITGHVYAVVIPGTEVERREAAMLEVRSQVAIAADQRDRRIVMVFRLNDAVFVDRAELTDRSIHRTDEVGLRERARLGTQRARKKLVECCVAFDIRIRRFRHVDAVMAYEPPDDRRGDAS